MLTACITSGYCNNKRKQKVLSSDLNAGKCSKMLTTIMGLIVKRQTTKAADVNFSERTLA